MSKATTTNPQGQQQSSRDPSASRSCPLRRLALPVPRRPWPTARHGQRSPSRHRFTMSLRMLTWLHRSPNMSVWRWHTQRDYRPLRWPGFHARDDAVRALGLTTPTSGRFRRVLAALAILMTNLVAGCGGTDGVSAQRSANAPVATADRGTHPVRCRVRTRHDRPQRTSCRAEQPHYRQGRSRTRNP